MVGIYKVENIVNGKIYIGQSKDIEKRWLDHKYKRGRSLLVKDIMKYGSDAFVYSVVEECEEDRLDELEIHYIRHYNCLSPNGYNYLKGGKGGVRSGEENPKAVLTDKEVYCIREDYNNHVSLRDSYQKYAEKVTINGFRSIWNGKARKDIHMDVYTPENKKWRKENIDHVTNHFRIVNDEDVLNIRDIKKEGVLSRTDAMKMFPHINPNTFSDVWYGHTFKHLQSQKEDKRKGKMIVHRNQNGDKNPGAKFTANEVLQIRKRKELGERFSKVYSDYKDRCTPSCFSNLWTGRTYVNI